MRETISMDKSDNGKTKYALDYVIHDKTDENDFNNVMKIVNCDEPDRLMNGVYYVYDYTRPHNVDPVVDFFFYYTDAIKCYEYLSRK